MCRRITRAIFAAAAAGATIATFGLAAAGTAAAGPVRVAGGHHFAGYHASARGPALVVTTRHLAGYQAASNERRLFRYAATTLRVSACKVPVAPTRNPVAVMALFGGRNWDAEYIAANEPSSASGTVTLGMSVAQKFLRNTRITITTRPMVSISVNSTSATEARIVLVRSRIDSTLMEGGILAVRRGSCALIWSTVSMTLAPGCLKMISRMPRS